MLCMLLVHMCVFAVPQPLNHLTELLRIELSVAGFTEVLTWSLCSKDENFKNMLVPKEFEKTAVSVSVWVLFAPLSLCVW